MNLLFHSLYELGIRQGFRDLSNKLEAWTLDLATGELVELKEPVEVPTRIGGRGNTGASNFLYDTSKYVLDASSSFWKYTVEILEASEDKEALKAVNFYLAKPPEFGDAPFGKKPKDSDKGPWVLLALKGEPLCNRPKLLELYAAKRIEAMNEGVAGVCLISGKPGSIARLHPALKFGADDKGADARLVSFNESSMKHFGTTQGFNYPVSGQAIRYYVSALNQQLKSFSAFLTQNCAIVMWPNEGTEHRIIPVVKSLTGFYFKDTDVAEVEGLWAIVKNHLNDHAVLHLASMHKKQSRIVVRNYDTITVAGLCSNLWRFRAEFRNFFRVVSLRRILPHSSRPGDPSLTDPNFLDTAWAVLFGTPYPVAMPQLIKHQFIQRGNYNSRVVNWIRVIHNRTKPSFKEAPLMFDTNNEAPVDSVPEDEVMIPNELEESVHQKWEDYVAEVDKYVDPNPSDKEDETRLYTFGRIVALRMLIEIYYHNKRRKFTIPNLLSKTLQSARRPKAFLGSTRFARYANERYRIVAHHEELFQQYSPHLAKTPHRLSDAQNFEVLRGFFDQKRGYDERSELARSKKAEKKA